ncbi:MAG: acyl-CoA dehydrogenase N-terminal domain-containing protein [Nitriliruptorales bacterium]
MDCTPPLRDIGFVLERIAGLDDLQGLAVEL